MAGVFDGNVRNRNYLGFWLWAVGCRIRTLKEKQAMIAELVCPVTIASGFTKKIRMLIL